METLEAFAERGRPDLGTATLRMHQRFFPLLGTQRSALTQRAMRNGTFVSPPPMHPFFATALELAVVNDREGPQRALARFGTADHAIGLSRCFIAGAVTAAPSQAFGLGASMAAVTHADRKAVAFGGFLGMVACLFLRGRDLQSSLEMVAALGLLAGAPLLPVVESVSMAQADSIPPKDSEFMPCTEVARLIGCYGLGKNGYAKALPKAAFVIEPLTFPLLGRTEVTIPGSRIQRIEAAIDAAVAAKVIQSD